MPVRGGVLQVRDQVRQRAGGRRHRDEPGVHAAVQGSSGRIRLFYTRCDGAERLDRCRGYRAYFVDTQAYVEGRLGVVQTPGVTDILALSRFRLWIAGPPLSWPFGLHIPDGKAAVKLVMLSTAPHGL